MLKERSISGCHLLRRSVHRGISSGCHIERSCALIDQALLSSCCTERTEVDRAPGPDGHLCQRLRHLIKGLGFDLFDTPPALQP
jgi:hypothetical protein